MGVLLSRMSQTLNGFRKIFFWCPFKMERGRVQEQPTLTNPTRNWLVEKSDEELARMLQAEEEALMLQQYAVRSDGGEFEQRIRPYIQQVLMYEDPVRQDAARKTVPFDEIEEKASVSLAKEGIFKPSKNELDHAVLLQLLFWFKQSFRWVNSPSCEKCSGETMNIGMGSPEQSEKKFGGHRVEIYRCKMCSSITRFPRYNDPLKLLETRRGRCGEWANCFTLYCRAFGYEARLIVDFTDHVWTECFSLSLGRWMHLDPCEGVYDNPLLYEKGWNKKLNYTIAIAKDGVYDVTKRYTRKWHEVLSRRSLATETNIAAVLSLIRKECRNGYSAELLIMLEDRDKKEAEELEREVYRQSDVSISLPGRQSGAIEWRRERLECGSGDSYSLSSSCPKRSCVDVHVSAIYTSMAMLCSQMLTEKFSLANFVGVLETTERLMKDLKSKSFRNRTSFMELKESQISNEMIFCIKRLLSATSLKLEIGVDDGKFCVSLSADPVQTSIALPVTLDVINEIIDNIKGKNALPKVLQFPTPNRLCSGLVLASGEELPSGIAASAFDGTFSTKWEEPNGAKGCWLIYEVPDEQMYELQSYDFVSANDAPERDPMDWILEAKQVGGSTWILLDEQKSQIFDRRFQRKAFTVKMKFKSNLFRFKFLAVKDGKANGRFQIGGINLYT
ncbi:peptide-N(4)-(N-acetyl-beta-glucosaminyl)asparagine amidase isoform X2 [Curcuma longa]|uniref:peptide-N(4)-(N-acetyl-beta- glucosaminyl)asparagine amidase isoform X2 n=1 Tax=Curcuma longa TaxID=136217 RepID=UPI003D9E8240